MDPEAAANPETGAVKPNVPGQTNASSDSIARLSSFLRQEPAGQPEPEAAPDEANQLGRDRNERGQFTKAEPEAVEEQPAEAQAETGTAETSDHEELASYIDDLASQLGHEPDELRSYLKERVKVDGEEQEVTLAELKSGYQRQSDYSRKTATLAEERRSLETERSAYQQNRDQLASQLQPLVEHLEKSIEGDPQLLNQLLQESQYDPDKFREYEQLRIQYEARRSQLDAAKREQQRISQEQQAEARSKLERAVAENERLLVELKPEWGKDPEKGRKELNAVRQYLRDQGAPSEEVNNLFDARSLVISHKAMMWDALQKEKSSQLAKVKNVPKFQKPGASQRPVDTKKQVHRDNLNRLRRTGGKNEAIAAFKTGGYV